MRTRPITLTHLALVQLVHTLQLSGQWLLPGIAGGENSAQNFVAARTEWENNDLVEQDFDGALYPQPKFARMLYNMTHARGAIRLETDEQTIIYLRGPVDLLCLIQSKESSAWSLALRPTVEAYRWAKQTLLQAAAGELTTEGSRNGGIRSLQADLSQESTFGEKRLALLNEHLFLFFEQFQWVPLNNGG